MSEAALKTQEEWPEEFKRLAKEAGEALAVPLREFFADKIILTQEEVEAAREERKKRLRCGFFLTDKSIGCVALEPAGTNGPECALCEKLTRFAEGEEDG